MEETEILEGNKLIAEFIGPSEDWKTNKGSVRLYFKPGHNTPHCEAHELKYHSDWNWLMLVVEKISKHNYEDGDTAYMRTFGMLNAETGDYMVRINRYGVHEAKTLIEATFMAVVEYIKFDNEQSTH